MEQYAVNYRSVIRALQCDADFNVIAAEYSYSHFGNYLIEINYKNAVAIEIINDRSKIEIDVLISGLLSMEKVPLAFAAEQLLSEKDGVPQYVYDDSQDMYDCLVQNKSIFDMLRDKHRQRTILRKWRRKRYYH